jgi:hypothetical protein
MSDTRYTELDCLSGASSEQHAGLELTFLLKLKVHVH